MSALPDTALLKCSGANKVCGNGITKQIHFIVKYFKTHFFMIRFPHELFEDPLVSPIQREEKDTYAGLTRTALFQRYPKRKLQNVEMSIVAKVSAVKEPPQAFIAPIPSLRVCDRLT